MPAAIGDDPVERLDDIEVGTRTIGLKGPGNDDVGIRRNALVEARRRLAAASCPVDLVYSSNRDLDVLPRGVNKGSATAYLASQWSFAGMRVIVSGDSGNDLAMFENGFLGIVVSNAHRELKRLDSSRVYQANRPHAAGVREGLCHWLGWVHKGVGLRSNVQRCQEPFRVQKGVQSNPFQGGNKNAFSDPRELAHAVKQVSG